MPYDEVLARRVSEVLAANELVETKKMFGGVGYMVKGNMACGVHGDRLIVRVGPDRYAEALADPFTDEFDLTGRPMKGWITVRPEGTESREELVAWIEQGLVFVHSLEPK